LDNKILFKKSALMLLTLSVVSINYENLWSPLLFANISSFTRWWWRKQAYALVPLIAIGENKRLPTVFLSCFLSMFRSFHSVIWQGSAIFSNF